MAPLFASHCLGLELGMATGNVENALMSLALHSGCAYMQGLPLWTLEQDIEVCLATIIQYNSDPAKVVLEGIGNLVKALAGKVDVDEWLGACPKLRRSEIDTSLALIISGRNVYRTHVAFYFGDYEKADRCRQNVEMLLDLDRMFIRTLTVIVYGELIAAAFYRKSKKRKYKRQAAKYLDRMKEIVKKKGLTNLNKYYLMEADFVSTFDHRAKKEEVKRLFEKAIATSTKSGLIQDAALANELCGDYFLSAGDTFWARHYFTKATEHYRDWGATAKVMHLFKTRSKYIELNQSDAGATKMKSSQKNRKWLIQKVADASSDLMPSGDEGLSISVH